MYENLPVRDVLGYNRRFPEGASFPKNGRRFGSDAGTRTQQVVGGEEGQYAVTEGWELLVVRRCRLTSG